MSKPALLYLVHRIPFPPNKGDKIRSYNILRELTKFYTVHVVCFMDDPHDAQYIPELQRHCASLYVEPQNKLLCKVKAFTGFMTGKPLSLPYYGSRSMQRRVDEVIKRHQIQHALVFSSTMGQFIYSHPHLRVVTDFVDVDSDKWRQYAQQGGWVNRFIYQREHKTLEREEQKLCERSAHSTFVSPQEAELFQHLMPIELKAKITHLYNGVDVDYFSPNASDVESLPHHPDVCFTGAMDYWANVDAVLWFHQHVWPRVRQSHPQASFYIVGGNPTDKVKALHGQNGVVVTGRVKDVRPYVLQAKINVAPLQIARGIQNKVLEAMSLAKPVIATSLAIEGIDARNPAIVISDVPTDFATHVIQHLQAPQQAPASRDWIIANLRWDNALARLPQLVSKEDFSCESAV